MNVYVLMVFFGLSTGETQPAGAAMEHVLFPYRAECDYAAKKINEEIPGAKAFCFDVRVAGDRHETESGLSQTP